MKRYGMTYAGTRRRSGGMGRRGGFTLTEMMIVVVVIGIIGMIVVPEASSAFGPRLRTAANVLAADIEFCASQNVSAPGSPVVLKFDLTNNKYWIAPLATPTAPITHPADGKPYVNDFATGRTGALSGVQVTATSLGATPVLTFDAYGRPQTGGSDVTVTLATDRETLRVTVDGATGDVSVVSP